MSRLKVGLRIGGIVTASIGLMCFPLGFGVNPKRDLSLFNNLADLGAFVQMGFALVALGLLGIGLSCVVPGEMDE